MKQSEGSPPTHTLYSSATMDRFPSEQSAARHFELAFSPQPMTKWERYASWSLPNLTPTPLEWRRFILWLAGLSLSWLFACYGSVKHTETRAGGWMCARRPVWRRVESCQFCWMCLWSLVKGQEVTHWAKGFFPPVCPKGDDVKLTLRAFFFSFYFWKYSILNEPG